MRCLENHAPGAFTPLFAARTHRDIGIDVPARVCIGVSISVTVRICIGVGVGVGVRIAFDVSVAVSVVTTRVAFRNLANIDDQRAACG
jgi:hypothetical protein